LANLGDIRARVKRNLRRLQVSDAQDEDINVWVNQIVREDLCADHLWPFQYETFTMSTTAGVELYSFPNPDNFKDCAWIEIRPTATDAFRELTETSERALLRRFSSLATGQPRAWAMSGEYFRVKPTPDASTYLLKACIWSYPDELTQDANSNKFTRHFSKLVELGVTARACLQYGNSPEKWNIWNGLYREELGKAIATDRRAHAPSLMTLKPSLAAGKVEAGLSGIDSLNYREPYSS